LPAELLAEVYLAMTRGQETLVIDLASGGRDLDEGGLDLSALDLIVLAPTEAELAAASRSRHRQGEQRRCVWATREGVAHGTLRATLPHPSPSRRGSVMRSPRSATDQRAISL
jgi:hypothetical protein